MLKSGICMKAVLFSHWIHTEYKILKYAILLNSYPCYDVRVRRKKQKKGNFEADADKNPASERSVSSEALRGVSAIFFVATAIFLVLARFGIGGIVGAALYKYLSLLLGVGYLLLPLSLRRRPGT